MVTSFACHEAHGASAIVFAPVNQLLITGGRKGDVFVFDMRQRVQRYKFQAHESAVKCLALDPGEEFFVSGSADGDIKVESKFVLDLDVLNLTFTFYPMQRFGAWELFTCCCTPIRASIQGAPCFEIWEWASRICTWMAPEGCSLVVLMAR